MNLTSAEILKLIKDWIKASPLAKAVPTIYENHYPRQALNKGVMGEFIVINVLSNATGDGQSATVNVNIYVPDDTTRIRSIEQRFPDTTRLAKLSRIAYEALKGYPVTERWWFDVSSETIIKEEGIPYSFSNIRVSLKRF